MTNHVSKIFRQKEAGFTLIEVLVAVFLGSIIALGASAGIYQLLGANSTNANTVTVTTNINSATDYLRDDIQVSAIKVSKDLDGNNVITGIGSTETEWLWLEWTWPDGAGGIENHRVTYQIEGNKLYRTHKIIGSDSPETRTMIAQYIDAGLTGWELLIGESNEVTVEITISASTGGYKSASESRTIQVAPRIAS